MPEYLVTWEIEIDADSPKEAAEEALAIMRDPLSDATVFTVVNNETDEEVMIDLTHGDENGHYTGNY